MSDTFTPEKRSWIMSRVKSKDTEPEIAIRSMIHKMGFRFRLHRKNLPGSPDLVFPKYKKVIFVHGCFWHGHKCRKGRLPDSNRNYWKEKIRKNRNRDKNNVKKLTGLGWQILIIWECSVLGKNKPDKNFRRKVNTWLEKKRKSREAIFL